METTRAEQPHRVRRLLPPAWIFRGAGYSASRPAHPQQYTPFTAVARSHTAPHPSHTFKSIRKPFIVPFRSVVLPPASLGLFQRSSGLTQVASEFRSPNAGALSAPSVQRRHSAVFLLSAVYYLGKNRFHPALPSTPGPDAVPAAVFYPSSRSRASRFPVSFWKVSRL